MDNQHLIPVQHVVTHYHAEVSFVNSLHEYGLINITTVDENNFIDEDEIKDLERMIHLHYDLDINLEGIDAIRHLMNKIHSLNIEMIALKNRLERYE